MKASNKELVLEAIREHESSLLYGGDSGMNTRTLSERLGIQRANMSNILNQLVKEGFVEKSNGRPVLYYLKNTSKSNRLDNFQLLIGSNGSLHNAIQLAKAAILYPDRSLNLLIIGSSGTGKSYFVTQMRQFAIEHKQVKKNSAFIKLNCKNYVDDLAAVSLHLFSDDKALNFFDRAKGGILFLDHIELLSPSIRTRLFDVINSFQQDDGKEESCLLICACNNNQNSLVMETLERHFPVKIKMPSLMERPLEERLALIRHFCGMEAVQTKRTLHVNSELLRCLLLYESNANVKQLQIDIKIGCANAYVREFMDQSGHLNLFLTDFPNHVRKGFLNYKKHHNEIEALIPAHHGYIFPRENMENSHVVSIKNITHRNLYDMIEEKIVNLRRQGISESEINMIVGGDIEEEFYQYSKELSNQIVNVEQLKKIVHEEIITMCTSFLQDASNTFHRFYQPSCLYGICLHMQSTIFGKEKMNRLSNRHIIDIVEKYKNEYEFSTVFAEKIEEMFHIILPTEEVVFITMFISDEYRSVENEKNPVILVAMHGAHTASSIVQVILDLGKGGNVFAYDMDLNKDPQDAYEELKSLVAKINLGNGILLIYDMGSFATMAEMIQNETGIKIKYMEVPITLIGLDCSRRALMEPDLDILYEGVVHDHSHLVIKDIKERKSAIITLCMSGEGGALQIKQYIEKHVELTDIDIFPLAISKPDKLQKEIANLQKRYSILCICGSYDPFIVGIPFISLAEIFACPSSKLVQLLKRPSAKESILKIDYDTIYAYLQEQLPNLNMEDVKAEFPSVMEQIRNCDKNFTKDQELGLLIHIACCISRLLNNEKLPFNLHVRQIEQQYVELGKRIQKILKVLEETFHVVFDDNEIATIIAIIKNYRKV